MILGAAPPTGSAAGGTIISGGTLTCAPPATFVGEDSFTYTLSDGRDGTAAGRVAVNDAFASTPSLISIIRESGSTRVRWRELTARSFQVQSNDTLTGPWVTRPGTITSDGSGVLEFFDTTTPAPPQRFYRPVLP